MATQPQKDNLIELFQKNISDNNDLIADNEVTVKETQLIIDNFDPSCEGLDGRIVTLVNNINDLKEDIVSLYSSAAAVGCGTTSILFGLITVGLTTIYPDTAVDSSYNLSSSTYDNDEPYEVNNTTLTSSNVGFGTLVIYKKDDNQSSGIGFSYRNIDTCYGLGCNSGNCINFANQIAQKENQISILRSELDSLVPATNSIRTERLDYQIRRWADKNTIRTTKEESQRIQGSINVLNNPDYDSYI